MTARLQDWLVARALHRPEATAAVFEGGVTTYGDLDAASNRLAASLRIAGCSQGDRVALLLPKSPRALIGMFGALKAGCIYVPIDTSSPIARIGRILQLCDCHCILAEQSTAGLLTQLLAATELAHAPWVIWMDAGGAAPDDVRCISHEEMEACSSAPVASSTRADDPAHILFTSGSTGMPKGVVITHANIIHFVRWALDYFQIGPQDRISGHPPLHFDLSTFDIYGTIAAGAQIHLLPPALSLIPHRLADFIRQSELTQWFSVPSALLPLARLDALRQNDFPTLRRLLWCGEKFPVPALRYWMQHVPHARFYNLYGPTEATIASSCYHVRQTPAEGMQDVPIGQPCDGEELIILDDRMKPITAPGEIGDLYIGGVGLSPGYWKDSEKTAQLFRTNPYSADPEARLYKTGDLAKADSDNQIYIIGRSDSQIKLRGFRIELGEIESAVHAVPGIQDAAVVVADAGEEENKRICCAFAPIPNGGLSPESVRKSLRSALPPYMLPDSWLVLETLPHNGNGKTDRVELKRLFTHQLQLAALERVNPIDTKDVTFEAV